MSRASQVPWWRRARSTRSIRAPSRTRTATASATCRALSTGSTTSPSSGCDAIWVCPFYPSPKPDFGYDVADYCDVDPAFGTLETSTGWSTRPRPRHAGDPRLGAEPHLRPPRVVPGEPLGGETPDATGTSGATGRRPAAAGQTTGRRSSRPYRQSSISQSRWPAGRAAAKIRSRRPNARRRNADEADSDECMTVVSPSVGQVYGSRVAVALVPAAQVWPPAFAYIARSTTIG